MDQTRVFNSTQSPYDQFRNAGISKFLNQASNRQDRETGDKYPVFDPVGQFKSQIALLAFFGFARVNLVILSLSIRHADAPCDR